MPKRALIAEPDHEEALRQAAILQDDGYEAQVFSGTDLIGDVAANPPDVLVLRQERPGQSGTALVARLKAAAKGTAIVLTTSELTTEAIDKNRRQKVHADSYLKIPADRTELLAAAHSIAEVSESIDIAVEEERLDKQRPPPLPPSGLKGLTQARVAPRTGEAVLSADDLTFVEKVFSTIQHVDIEQPAEPQASAERAIDGGDRKVALLRTELKRRERELAKLSRLWKAREDDLRQKEARVEQKDIEIEGMRLRVQELSGELDRANATLVDKEAEFGKAIGDTYDNQALQQAELIQAVAKTENEVNALKTKLRRAEDAFAAERTAFTERIFEWEKAYADLQQHHWKVVEASVDEVARLEAAIVARESDRKRLSVAAKDSDSRVAHLQLRVTGLQAQLRAVEHAHGRFEDFAVAVAQTHVAFERRGRAAARDDAETLQLQLASAEQDLFRHAKVLKGLEKQRLRDVSRVVAVSHAQAQEIVRLDDERGIYRSRANAVEAALQEAKALGEATIANLFQLEDKRRIVGEVQTRVRDEKIGDLREELARLSTNLTDVTERLGASEMEATGEHARAEELEVELQSVRDEAAESEHRLATDLETRTSERDKLADDFQRIDHSFANTKEQLSEERQSRKQRELEINTLVERKDNDLALRNEKISEIERSLQDAREDLTNLRKTVTLRDDRITELLNRVRQADEQQIALEGQVYRLTTSATEKDAELAARGERVDAFTNKLQQRESRLEAVEAELRAVQSTVLDKQALVERHEQGLAQQKTELGRARDEQQRMQAELEGRAQALFESERRASQIAADLSASKADQQAGAVVSGQLQSRLSAVEARGQELRRSLEDADSKLRQALLDLDATGQRAEQQRNELGQARELTANQDVELGAVRLRVAEVERARDQLQTSSATLRASLAAVEAERGTFEEQLANQLRENAELSAALSDASQHLQTHQQRALGLEGEIGQREGRIAAQAQVLNKAEQQLQAKDAELLEKNEELSDLREKVDDARAAIDERAKWLATREQTIAELKGLLEAERKAKDDTQGDAQKLQQQSAVLKKNFDDLRARLEDRERLLQAQGQHSQAEIERESNRAERVGAELKEARAANDAQAAELATLRADAARLPELRASEEKLRGDAQKLRQFAERASNDTKASRILLEKTDAAKKLADTDAARLRAELDDIRNAQRQGDAFVTQARLEAEQRSARMRELEAQLTRAVAARDASERARAEAESEAQRVRANADVGAAGERDALQAELQRLTAELTAAKRAQNDAVATAKQARAEADQIKKLAAEKIRQAQSAPPRTLPKPIAPPSTQANATAVHTLPPMAFPGSVGLAPPAGATSPGLSSLPSLPSGASDGAFEAEETVVVDKVVVPLEARGPKSQP